MTATSNSNCRYCGKTDHKSAYCLGYHFMRTMREYVNSNNSKNHLKIGRSWDEKKQKWVDVYLKELSNN